MIKNTVRMDKMDNRTDKRAIQIIKLQGMAKVLIFASALLPMLASCVKDELHDTPHPDKGAIVVQMDWSSLPPEAVADNYILNVDGYEQTVSGTTNTVERLSELGEHSLMAYNVPDGITVSGDIASVDEDNGTRAAGSRIKPMPGYLFSLSETICVEADDTLRITAKPRQWVRQVNMELTVTEGDYDRISTVTGTLAGVERSVDIRKGERQGTAAEVRGTFTVDGNKCRASFRLMGIVPTERQTLKVDIVLSNGDTQRIVSDLTEQMSHFHDDNTPLMLTGNLRLPMESGMTGSIEGWQQADGGNTDAH